MHYFLADRLAHTLDPGSRAVLLDQEGFVSEASTANMLFYRRGEGLVSPPRERILPGVSLSVLAELAAGLGIAFHFRRFRLEELAAADEILMCSTSPCVWPVTRLNGQPLAAGCPGTDLSADPAGLERIGRRRHRRPGARSVPEVICRKYPQRRFARESMRWRAAFAIISSASLIGFMYRFMKR